MFWDKRHGMMGNSQRRSKGRHRNKGATGSTAGHCLGSSKQHTEESIVRTGLSATSLDSENKRTAHFKSSWQQHVNVFSSSSRPACVEELHQEAQLNLQSLLQDDYEEQHSDCRVAGQTFRCSSSVHSGATPDIVHRQSASKRTDFVFLPATKQVCEDETTTVGIRLQDPPLNLPNSPEKNTSWNKAFLLPTPEKTRWRLGRSVQAHVIPINVSGQTLDKHASLHHSLFNAETAVNPKSTLGRRRTIIGIPELSLEDQGDGHLDDEQSASINLTQGSYSPEGTSGRHSAAAVDSTNHFSVLRKTYSDLDQILSQSPGNSSKMDHTAMMCASPSWNGPKDSTFSPSWNNSFSYMLPASPVARQPCQSESFLKCTSQGNSELSMSSGSYSNSFTSVSVEPTVRTHNVSRKNEIEATTVSPGHGTQTQADGFKFRERSLSTPTDSGSFCSAENICFDHRKESDNYAMHYPSASSEDSASADNVSITANQNGHPRQRSRSISLKKPKKKPAPPVRNISLKKDEGLHKAEVIALTRSERPKSLFIPRNQNIIQNSFLSGPGNINSKVHGDERGLQILITETPSIGREGDTHYPNHWYLNDWKSNDPYRSLSNSSTATGTTVIECMKVCGSSDSLTSLTTSRATSPSQLSVEAESKISPLKPPGFMSPSSGYSSQSETPTPTIPTSLITGPSPQGCRMRPKVPIRKSSLPAVSPREKSSRSRLSFELPIAPPSHLDLSGITVSNKGKPKASRRHSDSSTNAKPVQKLSPNQAAMPIVTQSDLRSIRLRSVSKSEPEDNADGSSDIIEEKQSSETFVTPQKKVKPPVAEKPPLPKRPGNLMLKLASAFHLALESPPLSPKEKRSPADNTYTVVKKPQAMESPSSVHVSPPQQITDLDRVMDSVKRLSQGSQEGDDKSKTLPKRITVQSLADTEKKRSKIPPPVPKKPNILLLPTNSVNVNGATDRPVITLNTSHSSTTGSPMAEVVPRHAENQVKVIALSITESNQDQDLETSLVGTPTGRSIEDISPDKTPLSITEEDDDVFVQTTTSHTTEDLFTLIHRSKRKVLGRVEPGDTFGSRQSLVSPIKSNSPATSIAEQKSASPVSSSSSSSMPRSRSRNDNFIALLQKKGSRPSPGTRVSAMELLKSTNPLARRVTEFSQAEFEPTKNSK
ncbi:NHS-like protein 2 isoform X3 [Acipenser oxyrinchus oxyrinchus]|uniref:NHS-like protein 2 isoform X3 n=1 Tax=Acipenser oxyrinchus oxyrinchus TaxID=40147 RepID=A0AAD8DCX2_ACIOX|nr:NHS-like protein 2 isoform X3 [Acipenser oxyrinchus oxyrinchus]